MKSLEELIDERGDAWPQVEAWRTASPRSIELLDCARSDGKATLLAAQVTTRSPMGASVLHCGGIRIDRGWTEERSEAQAD